MRYLRNPWLFRIATISALVLAAGAGTKWQ